MNYEKVVQILLWISVISLALSFGAAMFKSI